MTRIAGLALAFLAPALLATPAAAREAVYASAPAKISVTVYRDPERSAQEAINRDYPQGFAVISETRSVTLPPGESTIRFEGVAEGMVAVSAIVTGLPGGTIEKNRNAALLSPAALVDGTLGNRVTITRTNPATGQAVSESAVVRTRADGGLVLQTARGFEAVRCSGLPEKLTFAGVPEGLSAQPVFSVDTRDAAGGTYEVQLTYISWGFDWQAHYVGTRTGQPARSKGGDRKESMRLRSWLTLVNDNGQSFEDAQLLVVAGRLNVDSDFQNLADPPQANPLWLTCYPLGSTAAGSPLREYAPYPAPPPLAGAMDEGAIVVTAQYRAAALDVPMPVSAISADALATEENLGDLKLYRVPMPVTVAAKSMKQVAFLDREEVKGAFQYRAACIPRSSAEDASPMHVWFRTRNDKENGLGVALPMGGLSLFEPTSAGELLLAEPALRDYAEGQEVELDLGESPAVFAQCVDDGDAPGKGAWQARHVAVTNASDHAVTALIWLGAPADWKIRGKPSGLALRDGLWSIERTIPARSERTIAWQIADAAAEEN